jgi:hypothetical protein
MRGPISKVCECCRQVFTCGQYGCWCAEIWVTEQQMDWIEKSFHDCLCPTCLQKISHGEMEPRAIQKSQ